MEVIKEILKENNEDLIIDIYIKEYNKINLYIALVFNNNIKRYKILYVPLDLIEKEKVKEYFCYQFIHTDYVNYLLDNINDNIINQNKSNIKINSYLIYININLNNKKYKYTFQQFINKEYKFFLDTISIIFSYVPNNLHELEKEILIDFFESKNVLYNATYEVEWNNIDSLFSEEVKNKKLKELSFLQRDGNRYYGLVKEKLIIIDYFEGINLLNIYSGDYDVLGIEVYSVYKSIINNNYSKSNFKLNDILNKKN